MSGADQFFTFLVCALCGLAGGIIYDFFYVLRTFFCVRWMRILCDIAFCVLFSGMYLFVSVMMGLPGIRFYTVLGCLLGLILYLKSLHKIIAFFAKKVYNGIKQLPKGHKRWTRTRSNRRVTPKKK